MTDYAFYAFVVSLTCLCVEVANSIGIAYGIHWMLHAGANIVDRIAQMVGLKRGKGSILDSIKGTIEKLTPTEGGEGEESPIDLGQFGSYTPTELRGLAGSFAKNLKANGGAAEMGGGGMKLLQDFAAGKNVSLADGLPFLMQMLQTPSRGQAQLPDNSGSGTAWDS